MNGILIRNLEPEDALEAAALEQRAFGTPWSEKLITETIRQAADSRRKELGAEKPLKLSFGAIGVWKETRLAGYLFAMIVDGEGELHRIAVLPEFRRMGIAGLLMEAFLSWMKERGTGAATLEVRQGNTAAVSLYEKYGFREEGRRKDYYRNPTEDARIFWLREL